MGVLNRGRNLAGRNGPDDVPIVKLDVPTLAEEIAKANARRELYEEETAPSSNFTLRADSAYQDEKDSDHFETYQFKEQMDNALLREFGIERVPKGQGVGVSVGELSGSPSRGTPRRYSKKTWWAAHVDKVRELLKSIAASDKWPTGSDKRAGYVILYCYMERWEDQEIYDELLRYACSQQTPDLFPSPGSVKSFRTGLVKYAFELFGPDPDAEPEGWKNWRERVHPINTKSPWLRVAVHNSTLGVGPSRRKGVK